MSRRDRARVAHRGGTAVGYAVGAALLALVLWQVPWGALTGALGLGGPTYDELAVARTSGSTSAAPSGTDDRTASSPAVPLAPWHGRLQVPAWGTGFEVVDVSLDPDGALVPPESLDTLGRWDDGARPGDGGGTVVLVVHRDSWEEGRGPFAELENLPVGTLVRLGGLDYRLTAMTTYAKGELPAARVFGQQGPERLVIVTCGGSFSQTQGWDSNIVASFRRTGA